jgi:hypothetical protein
MRSGLAMVLLSFGVIFLALAITTGIIETLGAHYGTPHSAAIPLGLGSLVIGAVLYGAGYVMRGKAAST